MLKPPIEISQSQAYIHLRHLLTGNIMTVYQHKKGVIRDNALEALLHDPLFKPRVEANTKGRGSSGVVINMRRKVTGRPVASAQTAY